MRRRPGEGPFRRGSQVDASPERAGYVPFEPEPEDSLAVRPEAESGVHSGPRPPEDDATRPVVTPQPRAPESPAPESLAPESDAPDRYRDQREPEPVAAVAPPPQVEGFDPYDAGDADARPYGEPEDAYAYPYVAAEERGGGGGGGALPIIGFVVLCVLALAVGAVLAGLLDGDGGVGQQSSSPSVASTAPSVAPTQEPTIEPTEPGASATQEPQDGPVAFDDGALLTVQPCATNGYRDGAVGKPEEDACQVDGASVSNGEVWAFIVFRQTKGTDTLTVRLLANGQAINEQELVLGSVLTNCGNRCNGLIYGAHYVDLLPGDYELVLRRNGEFADGASFTVEG